MPQTTTNPNRLDNGEYTFKTQSDYAAAPLEFAVNRLDSEFINSAPINREAADAFSQAYPWATADDFEDKLFDTFETVGEYNEHDRNPDSQLNMFRDSVVFTELPSGGIAVFFE